MPLLNKVREEIAPIALVEPAQWPQIMMVLALRRPRFLTSVTRNVSSDDGRGW
jgi:hypothetical protein